MNIIKTGMTLTKTFKNMTRLKEIISVFARNGLDEFIIKSGLQEKIPDFVLPKSRLREAIAERKGSELSSALGYRLRKSFEELGPGFIKLGQMLASREDLFDEHFIAQMKKLQCDVIPIPFDQMKDRIEKSLNIKSTDELFEWIEPTPIGSASIGIVYKAKLKNGDIVVIKIRRPDIVKTIQTDFSIFLVLIQHMEKVVESVKYLGISRVVTDLSVTLQNELDFYVEAANCERFKKNLARYNALDIFHVPTIYREHCRPNIIVMEYLDGIPFNRIQGQTDKDVTDKIKPKLEEGIHVFVKTLLADGFFHADLHGGNFYLLKDDKIGVIDFGLVGQLSKKARINLVSILYSLLTRNYETAIHEFLDVADYETLPNVEMLTKDLSDTLNPILGLSAQQIQFPLLFRGVVTTLLKHRIYLPRDWFIVFRALMTLDGVGKSLKIDFEIFSMIEKELPDIIREFVGKDQMLEEALWVGRDLLGFMKMFPRHVKWMMKELSKKNYAIELIHKGHEKEMRFMAHSIIFLGYIFLSGMCLLAGILLLRNTEIGSITTIPLHVWFFWALGLFFYWKGTRAFAHK